MKAAGNVSCAAQPEVVFLSLNNKTSAVRKARSEAERGCCTPRVPGGRGMLSPVLWGTIMLWVA